MVYRAAGTYVDNIDELDLKGPTIQDDSFASDDSEQ